MPKNPQDVFNRPGANEDRATHPEEEIPFGQWESPALPGNARKEQHRRRAGAVPGAASFHPDWSRFREWLDRT